METFIIILEIQIINQVNKIKLIFKIPVFIMKIQVSSSNRTWPPSFKKWAGNKEILLRLGSSALHYINIPGGPLCESPNRSPKSSSCGSKILKSTGQYNHPMTRTSGKGIERVEEEAEGMQAYSTRRKQRRRKLQLGRSLYTTKHPLASALLSDAITFLFHGRFGSSRSGSGVRLVLT